MDAKSGEAAVGTDGPDADWVAEVDSSIQQDKSKSLAWARSKVGLQLLRLKSQWDNAVSYRRSVEWKIANLTVWPDVRVGLLAWADGNSEVPGWPGSEVLVVDIVGWWLDGRCQTCGGTKWQGDRNRQKHACGVCHGTGKSRTPHGWHGRALLAHMDSCIYLGRAHIKARIARAKDGGKVSAA